MNGRFRWCVIGLIALATVINYIDRNALAVIDEVHEFWEAWGEYKMMGYF